MQVIGAGVGRTGTYSLKIALNTLGFEPCYHMEAVLQDRAARVPLWVSALEGRPDWDMIFRGFRSAVDWPTARFFEALNVRYLADRTISVRNRSGDAAGDRVHSLFFVFSSAIRGRDARI